LNLWREHIVNPYYKTLAQFNLAVITFYQNLAQKTKGVSLEHVSETMSHLDYTLSQVNLMMNSFLNPTSTQQMEIPSWLNFDQLITTCKSLFLRLKPKIETMQPQLVSTPDDDFQNVMK